MSRRVVTRTYEYDAAGRMIKETEIVEDHTPPLTHDPVWTKPYQPRWLYPYVTYGTTYSTASVKPTV